MNESKASPCMMNSIANAITHSAEVRNYQGTYFGGRGLCIEWSPSSDDIPWPGS